MDVTAVENRPESPAKRDSLAEDLQDAGAAAQRVLAAVADHVPEVGSVTGVDVVGLSAANVRLHDITAEGHGAIGLRARDVGSSLIRRRFRRNRATIAETPRRNTKSPRLQIPRKRRYTGVRGIWRNQHLAPRPT